MSCVCILVHTWWNMYDVCMWILYYYYTFMMLHVMCYVLHVCTVQINKYPTCTVYRTRYMYVYNFIYLTSSKLCVCVCSRSNWDTHLSVHSCMYVLNTVRWSHKITTLQQIQTPSKHTPGTHLWWDWDFQPVYTCHCMYTTYCELQQGCGQMLATWI